SNLTATINWGDNTTPDTNVAVSGPNQNGQYTVRGTHTYTSSGRFTITVTVTDSGNTATSSNTSTATVATPSPTGGTGSFTVTGQNVKVPTGEPFYATVATVSDLGAFAGELVAKIDWGDGSWPSLVWVHGPDAQGNFTVSGWHRYDTSGNYTITV